MTITTAAFLKQLRLQALELTDDCEEEAVLTQLAELVFSHQSLLDESEPCVNLVNTLAQAMERKICPLAEVQNALWRCWVHLARTQKIDVFYFGQLDSLKLFDSLVGHSTLRNCYFIKPKADGSINTAAFTTPLAESPVSFILYDAEGAEIVSHKQSSQAIGTFHIADFMRRNNLPLTESDSSMVHALAQAYQRLDRLGVNHAIIGSASGYYAFTPDRLHHASNFSLHGMGLKQAAWLVEHLLAEHPHIAHFTFCFSYADFYFDLQCATSGYNQQMLKAFSLFSSKFALSAYKAGRLTAMPQDDVLLLSELVTLNRFNPTLEKALGVVDNLAHRNTALDSAVEVLTSTAYLDEATLNDDAEQRAGGYADWTRNTRALIENARAADAIKTMLMEAGKQVTWLLAPQPQGFTSQLSVQMKATGRQLLARLDEPGFQVWDLSEEPTFRFDDFRDGEYLNYRGAAKLLAQLSAKGLVL